MPGPPQPDPSQETQHPHVCPALIPETVDTECHHQHLQVLVLSDCRHVGHVCVQPDGSQHRGVFLQQHAGVWEVAAEREIYICSLLLAFSEAVASSSDFTYVLKGREEVYYLSQGAHAVPDLQKVVSHHSSFALCKKLPSDLILFN